MSDGGVTMKFRYNQELIPIAKQLRKEMTKEERRLWYEFLRDYPIRFKRQNTIGKYVVDFYCAKAKLIVELDGSQHFEEENIEKDRQRTEFLESYGLKVIRIPNNEVNRNFRDVCEYIDNEVRKVMEGEK